jgi:hypothetical protein
MGWESFHSVWDEPVDPPPGTPAADDKKPVGGKSWWDEFHDEDLTREGTADAEKYSYKDAFDDSDTSWYRRSSFKYSGYSDYSPSSLFRSSFSGFRYTGYGYNGENEAKNKAIRALRTLTRNANTLVDAAKKISYDVQFSSGIDSNGVSADLLAGKKQTIFVSPDKLVSTKTTDDEDAVIDALTGFVLLRVQMSQAIPKDVIMEVNSVSLGALPGVLAADIRKVANGALPPDAPTIAAGFIDAYMSGILAKSMLTRICRRKVVEDWGGFAPYFVRHAKQFAETREKIEAEPPAVESWAAKIAYNMIADEAAIEIDADISAIVEKHLGAELEHRQIFSACKNLIAELREYFKAKGETGSGDVEKAIADELESLVQAQKDADATNAAKEELMRENMGGLADFMDSLYDHKNTDVPGDNIDALARLENAAHKLKYKERLVQTLKAAAKSLEAAAEHGASESTMEYHRQQIAAHKAHFHEQMEALKKDGVDDSIIAPGRHSELPTAEKARKQAEDLNEFAKRAHAANKEEFKKLKREAAEAIKEILEKFPELKTALENFLKQAHELHEKFKNAADEKNCSGAEAARAACEQAQIALETRIAEIAKIEAAINDSKSLRQTPAGLQTFCRQSRQAIERGLDRCDGVINALSWNTSDHAVQTFMRAANHGASKYEETKEYEPSDPITRDHWHKEAIDDFVSRKMMTDASFKASAVESANKTLFDAIRELFEKTGMPHRAENLESGESGRREQMENLAASLGMSLQELLNALQASASAGAEYDQSDAEQIGKMVSGSFAEKLKSISAIDEQLFGQAVEKGTTILDGAAVTQVNDEARNAAEEEYVAYLSHSDAKPKTWVKPPIKNHTAYAAIARQIRNRNKAAIERIRNALCFQGTKRTGEVHGMLSGDLDEGGLHKLRYDSEHIWSQKQIVKLPDVAVGILVDQSGSMSGLKIEQAREICILLAEAVKRIEGMHLHIYGHSANMKDSFDLAMFEHYSSYGSANTANLDGLGAIAAHANNYDGYAIKEAAKMLDRDPAKKKYLFVISDGLPHGSGYAGEDAKKHVTSVCSFVRNRLKIPTYAFAVGVPKSEQKHFEEQYGKNHVIFLSTVQKCLPQLVRFLHNALQREKSLVSVEAD